jgi:hypothetical protein
VPRTPPVCSKEMRGQRQKIRKHTLVSIRMGKSTKKGKAWYLPLARAKI